MKRLIAAIVAAVPAACATAADDSDADPQTYLELYPTDSARDQINYWRTRLYTAQSGSERYRIEAILRDLNRQKEAEDEAAARAAVREADLVAKINTCLLRCPRPPPRP